MRDMKGDRIEPRIGNERADPESAKSVRRNRAAETARSESVAEARVMRDVLLDSPSSRYVAPDLPVARQDRTAKRERGYTKASPQGRREAERSSQGLICVLFP